MFCCYFEELYLAFMESIGAMNPGEKTNPLRTFAICCKIWNHPDVLHKLHMSKDASSEMDLDLPEFAPSSSSSSSNSGAKKSASRSSLASKASSNSQQPSSSSSSSSSSMMMMQMMNGSGGVGGGGYVMEDQGFNPFGNEALRRAINNGGFDPDWANRIMETYNAGLLANGAKFSVAFELIRHSVLAGDKILLFSQSLLSLNLIEEYLQRMDVPNSTTGEKWQKNKSYYR